jgi:poly-beta-1,6-N-acetyl-D-glucosamine synthase
MKILEYFRGLYLTTMQKFILSIIFALIWMFFSLWIAQTWIHSLADVVGYYVAYFCVIGIAILPGFMNAFVIASLLLDKRPKRKQFQFDEYPNITVLVSAYNEEGSISDTIKSIENQSYVKMGKTKVVIINDGSKDNTRQILKCYDLPWLKVLYLKKNYGKSFALNYALEREVNTDLVVTIDADSYLYTDALQRLVERYLSDPKNTIAVAGAVLVRNSRENWVTKIQEWDYFHGIASVKRIQSLYGGTLVAQGAFSLYKTEEIKKINGWPECVGEDIVLTWDLLKTGKRIGFAEDACLFTNAPTTWKQFIRQRQRWSRGLFEAFREHWHLLFRDRKSTLFVWFNVFFPYLDFVYTFIFIPGIIAAFFGYYYIASIITVLLLPLAMMVNYIMYNIQNKMFAEQNLKVRRNILGFFFYTILYGAILQPACVVGYVKELFSMKKTWGTK